MPSKMQRMSTADRLVESMAGLLWSNGYTGTSPRAVQRRAGAGQGSMYHHFPSKSALAHAAELSLARDLQAAADTRLDASQSCREKIISYLMPDADFLRGCRLGRLTYDEEVVGSDELRAPIEAAFVDVVSRISDVLLSGQAAGEVAAGVDCAAIADLIFTTRQGGYVVARSGQSALRYEAAVRALIALLDHSVFSTSPAGQ